MTGTDRQLATIMFSDIVGYTSLMNQNEKEGIELLAKNRSVHQSLITRFNGQFLKEMGDGVMASFPTVYDAVMCSAAILRASKEKAYQLRIGLHEGEVVINNEDIIGEGVNIASRLESIAKAGQILITESVNQNIRNKEGISSQSLGEKKLKNVDEYWRIYDLSVEDWILDEVLSNKIENESENKPLFSGHLFRWIIIGFIGAAIGTGIWLSLSFKNNVQGFTSEEVELLRSKTVTVLPFQGPSNGWLEEFGNMAPYWISKNLLEVTDGKVIDPGKAEESDKIPSDYISRTGLDIVIEGRYFEINEMPNNLVLFVDLIDLKSMEKKSLGQFHGSSEEAQKVLDEATQKILSIWSLSDRKRWAENPPRFDAFSKYVASEKNWGYDYERSINLLNDAFKLDTTFYEALLKISTAYRNMGQRAQADSVLKILHKRNAKLDPYSEMRMEAAIASLKYDYEAVADIHIQMAYYDPKDLPTLYNATSSTQGVNRIDKSIEFANKFLELEPDPECNFKWFARLILRIYYKTESFDLILDRWNSRNCPPDDYEDIAYPIKASVRIDRMDLFDSITNKYPGLLNDRDKAYMLEVLIKELYNARKENLIAPYAKKLAAMDDTGFEHWGQFFLGDYKKPIDKFEQRIKADSTNYYSWGHLGFMLANSGNTEQLEHLLKLLQNRAKINETNPDITYHLGVLHSLLGNNEEAVEHLSKAFSQGYLFSWHSYDDDFRLRMLHDDPSFKEFVKPRLN